ncbi:MAG TPA: adenylate/guanylate cyclase domain-containing protein [Kofleriaceae bacterium]|nr:adenylate/guanylate cyclase domain-containing protein [Kofleriaceae bacterium]
MGEWTSFERDLVADNIRREAERGERLVATLRALMYTVVTTVAAVAAQFVATPESVAPIRRAMFWATPLVLVLNWGWWWFVHSRPYRRLYGVISVSGDVLGLAGAMALSSIIFGPGVAVLNAMGCAPPLLGLFFVLAGCGVRQDPLLCLLAGAEALVGFAIGLAVAHHQADPSMVDPGLFFFASPKVWVARFMIIGFTAAMVALAARNARRLAADTGGAMAEQARVVQVFGRYVDRNVASAALAAGDGGAETREVTVLFTDLREFTATAERLEPAETLALLNDHYDALVPEVHRHGGAVNKFIGDAVMATFGAPGPAEDHARRALAAARGMLEAQDRLNTRLRAEGRPELLMGVGVATGPVVLGTLGGADRMEYAVIGDTVNTAARLEGLNKQLGTRLLFSEATRRALGDDASVRELGAHALKGKAQPVAVFTLD